MNLLNDFHTIRLLQQLPNFEKQLSCMSSQIEKMTSNINTENEHSKDDIYIMLKQKADYHHTHSISDITGFDISSIDLSEYAKTEDIKATYLTKSSAGETYSPIVHNHSISDISNLANTISSINSSISTLNSGKSNTDHKHSISDITDLSDKLDLKSDTGHTHTISDITDYTPPDLSTKADVGHKHVFNDITDIKTLSTKALFDRMYPTGSIYMSFTKQPPPFGQWELLEEGYFLRSTQTTSGEKGGTATHVHSTADHALTIDEIPSHNHEQRVTTNADENGSAVRNDFNGDAPEGMGYYPYEQGVNTLNTGGDQPHNHGDTSEASNVPPYITVYIYKRIDDTSDTIEIPDVVTTVNDTVDLTGYVKYETLSDYVKITDLSTKADSVHTHTLSDITDYTPPSTSQTITHQTGSNDTSLMVGTFCETDGTIYDKFKDNVQQTDCICNIRTASDINKYVIGIVSKLDPPTFATHGDCLIKVIDDEYSLGDIIVPTTNGFGKKATDDDIVKCVLYGIPRCKVISLETGDKNIVACMLF